MEYYVYLYRNPLKSREVFYVGKGTSYRWCHHLTPGYLKHDNFKTRVIKIIIAAGLKPEIEIIKCENEYKALALEKELITLYGRRCDGGTLVNHLEGGTGGPVNRGAAHPRYGTGEIYVVTRISDGETFHVDALYHWAGQRGLHPGVLRDIATQRVVNRAKNGNPVIRRSHKGYTCRLGNQ